MSFSLGIIGLPNVGKSTLFQALTKNKVEASNYPFCTIDPNVGVVAVPDQRLEKLSQVSKSAKMTPTTIEFVDIAGLVAGASKGEGLGNKFLAHIREVDAIVQVIRYFKDENVTHVHGQIDPEHDKEIINLELILADLETINNSLDKITSKMKGAYDKTLDKEKVILDKAKESLENDQLLSQLEWEPEPKKYLKQLNLLTIKPIIYLYNINESDVGKDLGLPQNSVAISAKIESELADMSESEAQEMLKELGIQKSGLDNLISASYQLLNLITYLTSGEQETRAWTVTQNTKAPQAAAVIHTDFEKGFIKAEVVNWQDFVEVGGWVGAKEKGKIRLEGKDYIVRDGDVIYFHFK